MKFSLRQKLFAQIRKNYFRLKSSGNLTFGRNIYIGKGCSIEAPYDLVLASDIYIGKNVTLEFDGSIGEGTLIANNVGIIGKTDHDHTIRSINIFNAPTVRDTQSLSHKTKIGRNVWLGYGCIVMSGVTISDGVIVAAGSVVTKDLPKDSIAAGNPAKVIQTRYKD